MSKKAFCLVFSLLLTSLIGFSSWVPVGAEVDGTLSPSQDGAPEAPAVVMTDDLYTIAEPSSETRLSQSAVPVLTINAISNYFGKAYAEYNEYTEEVRVAYLLKASKRLLTASWTLTYDSEVLSVDPAKNPVEAVSPIMRQSAVINFDVDGVVRLNATDMNLFDFSGHEAVFAQIVFDVKKLNVQDPEITTVDLSVDDLWISEPNPADGKSMTNKEVVLAAHGEVFEDERTDAVLVSKITSLTPSNFNENDFARSSADGAITSVPTTEASTAPTVTAARVHDEQPETKPAPKKETWTLVHTGRWFMAVLILSVLLVCSTVLFILRKRDIYDD